MQSSSAASELGLLGMGSIAIASMAYNNFASEHGCPQASIAIGLATCMAGFMYVLQLLDNVPFPLLHYCEYGMAFNCIWYALCQLRSGEMSSVLWGSAATWWMVTTCFMGQASQALGVKLAWLAISAVPFYVYLFSLRSVKGNTPLLHAHSSCVSLVFFVSVGFVVIWCLGEECLNGISKETETLSNVVFDLVTKGGLSYIIASTLTSTDRK